MNTSPEDINSFYQKESTAGNPYASLVLARKIIENNDITTPPYVPSNDLLHYVKTALPLPEAQFLMFQFLHDTLHLHAAASAQYPPALFLAARDILDNQKDGVPKAIDYLKKCVSLKNEEATAYLIRYYLNKKETTNANEIFSKVEFTLTDELKKLKGILNVMRVRDSSDSIKYLHDHPEDNECAFYSAIHYFRKGDSTLLEEMSTKDISVIGYENVKLNACLILARGFKNGTGVDVDMNKASNWFLKAVEFGFNGYYEIAECYDTLNDKKTSFEWYNKAAENGDLSAMVMIGKWLLDENNPEGDQDLARVWFEQASDMGSKEATTLLAEKFKDE
ncbi:Sel1 repeat-containing protein [Entamoeba marina]